MVVQERVDKEDGYGALQSAMTAEHLKKKIEMNETKTETKYTDTIRFIAEETGFRRWRAYLVPHLFPFFFFSCFSFLGVFFFLECWSVRDKFAFVVFVSMCVWSSWCGSVRLFCRYLLHIS